MTDPYFKRWRELQSEHLETVTDAFADRGLLKLRLFDEEMVGVHRLRLLGEELYGQRDPTVRLARANPFRMREDDEGVMLSLSLPLVERGEVDVVRHHDEIILTVGPYRRALLLPDSLKRREVTGARLSSGVLDVRFGVRDE